MSGFNQWKRARVDMLSVNIVKLHIDITCLFRILLGTYCVKKILYVRKYATPDDNVNGTVYNKIIIC